MSTTDPHPNPPSAPGWASRAPASPNAPGGVPPLPPRNSAATKARTIVGGLLPRLVAAAAVVALLFGAYWFFVVHKNDEAVADSIPRTGSCFSWTDAKGATTLPCADPAAVYKAEGSTGGTGTAASTACDSLGAYVRFGVTATRRNNSRSATICAALNVKVGDCVHQDATGGALVPCTSASGDDVKVVALQKVASAAETLSDATAMAVCRAPATSYLSDTAGTTIVCVGRP